MFEDGLHNRVYIYFLKHDITDRPQKGSPKLSDYPDMEDVPCRIIRGKKVLFAGDVKLLAGYELKDKESGVVYKVINGAKVYGVADVHHSSYEIAIKSESELYGQPEGYNRRGGF